MRLRWWIWVLAAVVLTGGLEAQQRVGIRVGLTGEWSSIPGRVDRDAIAGAMWGVSGAIEMRHPAVPGLTFVTRVGYVPERVSPATPQMTTLAGGVRLALLEIGNLTASTSFELEGMHFSPGAYNRAVGAGFYGRVDHESYYRGWRGGVRFSPAVDLWPTDAMGLRFAPALRWLGPVGHGGPEGDAAYVTFGLGVLLKLRP